MYRILIFEDTCGFSIKALIEYFGILSIHTLPNTRTLLTESVSSYIIYHLGPSPRTVPLLMRGRYRLIALVSVKKCMSINSSRQRHWGKVFLKDLFYWVPFYPSFSNLQHWHEKHTNTCTNTHTAISILAITSRRVLVFGRVTVIEVTPLGAVHSGPLSAVSCCCFFCEMGFILTIVLFLHSLL